MKIITFIISILFYFIGVAGLFYLILWKGDLLPFDAVHYESDYGTTIAILKNLSLVILFGLQHSIMARQSFKDKWTKMIPRHLERSTYVFISGLLCVLIAWQWTPIEGVIWTTEVGSPIYYILYAIFFTGIVFQLSSTFVIDHFELFGLQQAYHNLQDKIVAAQSFKEKFHYKIVRHPIYTGFIMILWATPQMTMTHFCLALMFTIYLFVGIAFEERDLIKSFGDTYTDYKKRVPSVIPFWK